MTLTEYQAHVSTIPFGKRLPSAVYVYWENAADFGTELNQLLATLAARHQLGPEFNVIKFRTDELKVSFLCYPSFIDEAHPALRHAVTIDLVSGHARHTDYAGNLNPPILHRKETFLPEHHPDRAKFEALTRAEEAEGLYAHPATIGFTLNWERLLKERGLIIQGHQLERDQREQVLETAPEPVIERHKTAMTRYDLSKPVKTLLEYGMLKPEATFFDYGCGQGSDVRGLQALGHTAEGWDPVHRPEVPKREADIVNMGFWSLLLQLGRLPEPEEYPQTAALREKIGSPKVALRIFIQKGGGDEVKKAAENRKRDLLVYVALANLRKRVPFGHLSQSLRFDIREFFGNYTVALRQGMELLYAAGDTGEIELACEELKVGWQDEQALYIHRSVLDELPPVLRA